MKNILTIILVVLIALFFGSCSFENEEDKRIRVKKECTEIIAKQNAIDLMDGKIADELNMFKSTWKYHGEDVNGAIEAQYSAAGGDGFIGDMAFLKFTQKLNLYGYRASNFNHIMTIQAEDWKEFNTNVHEYINKIEEEIQSTNNSILENEKNIEKINNKEDYYANYSRKERKENIKVIQEQIKTQKGQIDERNSAKAILTKMKANGYNSLTDDEKIDILISHYEKNPRTEFYFSYLPLTNNPKNLNSGLKELEGFIPLLDKINELGVESLSKEEKAALNPNNAYADDYDYPNNLIEIRKTFIDGSGWNSKHWAYLLATDFQADSIQVSGYHDDYHISETGDSVVAAIWGYQINYAGLTKALKEKPLKSGQKVYDTYIGNSGSNKNRRNFVMFVTKNGKKGNESYPQLKYNFRVLIKFDDTQKYSNRMIDNYTNSWSINEEQYQFFMKVYNNIKTKKSS
jgi:hypothetical protein